MVNMNFKRSWLYYIIGIIITMILFGVNKGYFLFTLIGFGIGMFLHNWIKELYDNTINAFYSSEKQKRDNRKKNLEQELERLNAGD